MKQMPRNNQSVSRSTLVLIIFLVVIGVAFIGGYHVGKSQQIPVVPQPTGILNQDYIASLTFLPLQGEMISDEDTSYSMPLLRKYTDGEVNFLYPVDFILSHDVTQATVLTKQARCINVDGTMGTCTGVVKLFSTYNTTHMDLNHWFIQEELIDFLSNGRVLDDALKLVKQTTIGGEKALFYDNGDPGHLGSTLIFLHKNKAYELSIISYGVPGAAATFREIASSLTFTQ